MKVALDSLGDGARLAILGGGLGFLLQGVLGGCLLLVAAGAACLVLVLGAMVVVGWVADGADSIEEGE